ncbi:MAG: trypsin-like serine protease [Alphaproteobacteria bacterium]|nr:trypsin-like serine protease [Alphaproteobacteria bacterium]
MSAPTMVASTMTNSFCCRCRALGLTWRALSGPRRRRSSRAGFTLLRPRGSVRPMLHSFFSRRVAAMALGLAALAGAATAPLDPPVRFAAHASGPEAKPDAARQRAALSRKPERGDDSCRWANDRECDEPDIGTGACALGTDLSDCRAMRAGDDDSCRWANDGECDEPRFGTGACVNGTDVSDCGDIARLRFRDDSCTHAFNGLCDEREEGGTGLCARRTDRTDCVGRERPLTINDHFFGRDDRVRVDAAQTPWAQVGLLRLASGETCTATLIGEDVVVTAAHCIHGDLGVDARGAFTAASTRAGGPFTADVIAYFTDPQFTYARFMGGDSVDGRDWALLRLDRPLGATIGYLRVRNALGGPGRTASRPALYQAGYGWDTGDLLAANIECQVLEVFRDNTFTHACDTTRGDSGSALIVRDGDAYVVAGVDSNFRSNAGRAGEVAFLYIAVSAGAFERYVEDFAAGRIGRSIRASPRVRK